MPYHCAFCLPHSVRPQIRHRCRRHRLLAFEELVGHVSRPLESLLSSLPHCSPSFSAATGARTVGLASSAALTHWASRRLPATGPCPLDSPVKTAFISKFWPFAFQSVRPQGSSVRSKPLPTESRKRGSVVQTNEDDCLCVCFMDARCAFVLQWPHACCFTARVGGNMSI